MSHAPILAALRKLRDGEFQPGPQWEEAHLICQAREGDPLHDWVHALVHRIEGDDANASYWYRRAGRTRHPGAVEEEWQAIWEAAAQA